MDHPTWAYVPLRHPMYLYLGDSCPKIKMNFTFSFWLLLKVLNDKLARANKGVTGNWVIYLLLTFTF